MLRLLAARQLRIAISAVVLTIGGVMLAPAPAPAASESVTLSAVPGSATPDTDAVAGKVTLTEAQPNTQFTAGLQTVTLTISQIDNGLIDTELIFPAPSVAVSGGHSVDQASVVVTPKTIQFSVATVANNTAAATISVNGIHLHTHDVGQVRIASSITSGVVKYFNVVQQSRIAGSDRYETSANALLNIPHGVDEHPDSIVLASGENFPDALSAINCCARGDFPAVLLTRPDSLSAVTRTAILHTGVTTIYIAGSDDVISQHVENQVREIYKDFPDSGPVAVQRFAGDDRYDTNALLVKNGNSSDGPIVLMASGRDFADGLALGPVARAKQFPLILTDGKSLTSVQTSSLKHAKTVIIAGGTAAVSTHVEDQLHARGLTVDRVSGKDRIETAANIARWETEGLKNPDGTPVSGLLGTSLGFGEYGSAYVANGSGFADALSFGQVAGHAAASLLLTRNASDPGDALITYLASKSIVSNNTDSTDQISRIVAAGGNAAISPTLVKQIATAIQR
jgi:putative cell wall-binding protein